MNKKKHIQKYSLALLGTGSDVGKSFLVTALCAYFASEFASEKNSSQKNSVAPFKAQNMSNNSAVVADGEIGHAQYVQAHAAHALPCSDMNPILLKPLGEKKGSQLIVHGKVVGNFSAHEYYRQTDEFFATAKESFTRLQKKYNLIIIEGAGSCGEVNLRRKDFTNFKMAAFADAPVLLVANIEQGGVFAQVLGTLQVLSQHERNRVKGILINRFRGDSALFADGARYIEKKTKLPILGIIPWMNDITIDAEDSFSLDMALQHSREQNKKPDKNKFHVAVIRLPNISNFTDFQIFANHPLCHLTFLQRPCELFYYDIVIIPGSKNTRADAQWLFQSGWDYFLQSRAKQKKHIHGICGGLQILGEEILDPFGVEGTIGNSKGLSLLPLKTILKKEKILSRVKAQVQSNNFFSHPLIIEGYEIHAGETSPSAPCPIFCTIIEKNQKPLSTKKTFPEGYWNGENILATYLHGIYDSPIFLHHVISKIRPELKDALAALPPLLADKNQSYRELGKRIAQHIDMQKIKKIIGL